MEYTGHRPLENDGDRHKIFSKYATCANPPRYPLGELNGRFIAHKLHGDSTSELKRAENVRMQPQGRNRDADNRQHSGRLRLLVPHEN